MRLQQDVMFVRLSHGLPRQSRKVKAEADIEPQRLRASAKLYSGTAFGKIKSFDSETRNELTRLTIDIPDCFRGTYVLPAAMTDKVTGFLAQRKVQREALVETFVAQDYEREREAAKEALRDSFRETDFPTPDALRRCFLLQWSIFRLDVPEGLPGPVLEQEREKFQARLDSVFNQCRAALRETMADLVGHLADRLAPDGDGSRKRLCGSTIENLREFLDTVNARDITSDEAIRELSDKARAVLGNYSADDLKTKTTGNRVRTGLEAVKKELDALIRREGGRKIDLDM